MRSYEQPKGSIQTLATGLTMVGLVISALAAVFDAASWIRWVGLVLLLAGVLLSISLLFAQWRKQR